MRGDGITGPGATGAVRRGMNGAGRLLLLMAVVGAGISGTARGSDDPEASIPPASPAASPGPRQMHLSTTSRMEILDETGRPVATLTVRPGETLAISVGNQARFAHNLYIGSYDALAANQTAELPGVPAFTGGSRSFLWTVPTSVEDLWFGCTVVGHFSVMKGRVVAIAEVMPDLVGLAEPDAIAVLGTSGLLAVERLEASDPAITVGTVLAQEPPAGSVVDPATVVRYTVSSGPADAG